MLTAPGIVARLRGNRNAGSGERSEPEPGAAARGGHHKLTPVLALDRPSARRGDGQQREHGKACHVRRLVGGGGMDVPRTHAKLAVCRLRQSHGTVWQTILRTAAGKDAHALTSPRLAAPGSVAASRSCERCRIVSSSSTRRQRRAGGSAYSGTQATLHMRRSLSPTAKRASKLEIAVMKSRLQQERSSRDERESSMSARKAGCFQ